jgi:hypothetical protein
MNAIRSFMAEMGFNRVYVIALEHWSDEVKNQNADAFLSKIRIGKAITVRKFKS